MVGVAGFPAWETSLTFPQDDLSKLRDQGLLRQLQTMPATGGCFVHEGRRWLNFSSNDYLNLVHHPTVAGAAREAIDRWGTGSTASRLMTGHLELHGELEQRLAAFLDVEGALLFGSGFLANVGTLTALAGPGDLILADKLNHASLIDGMRLSGARWLRYRHNDPEHLRELLGANPTDGRRIVVTDSVFSMDGDIAPLEAIATVAREFGALLVVDEAHAIGVQGEGGRGCCHGLVETLRPDIILGTFSKSLASYGGFVGCRRELRELLINRARTFIYSTALPPASVAAALAALGDLEANPGMAEALRQRATEFGQMLMERGLPLHCGESQILALMVGENEEAVALSSSLRDEALLATAVRPPTVPKGTARLRLSVTLAHEPEDLETGADLIATTWRRAATA
ncbi:MAG: 8-amino-7-oxononanoate synthase [Candidatus Sumerlaeia bacterium]|nr:8-amino-7-oxononanoate synthase [Candidatus Sumerlaeia bacterium]